MDTIKLGMISDCESADKKQLIEMNLHQTAKVIPLILDTTNIHGKILDCTTERFSGTDKRIVAKTAYPDGLNNILRVFVFLFGYCPYRIVFTQSP